MQTDSYSSKRMKNAFDLIDQSPIRLSVKLALKELYRKGWEDGRYDLWDEEIDNNHG